MPRTAGPIKMTNTKNKSGYPCAILTPLIISEAVSCKYTEKVEIKHTPFKQDAKPLASPVFLHQRKRKEKHPLQNHPARAPSYCLERFPVRLGRDPPTNVCIPDIESAFRIHGIDAHAVATEVIPYHDNQIRQ